jgi:hypothetical protein
VNGNSFNEGKPQKILNQWLKFFSGRLAQLVEQLPYKQRVGGSSPSTPTIFKKPPLNGGFLLPVIFASATTPHQRPGICLLSHPQCQRVPTGQYVGFRPILH